jgi:hypothetical protein
VVDLERELGHAHAVSEIKEPCSQALTTDRPTAAAEGHRAEVGGREEGGGHIPVRDQWPQRSKTNPLLRKLKTVRAAQQLKNTIACAGDVGV